MPDNQVGSASGIGFCSCSLGPAPLEKNNAAPQFLPPDVVNVSWEGSKCFRVENPRGGSIVLEEGTKECSPCDAFMAALGGCANLAILGQLQKNRITPGALAVKVSGIRKAGLPSAYEKIHVTFSIACDVDDAALDAMIQQAMTVLCPVAVTLSRAAEVTWEYRRVKAE